MKKLKKKNHFSPLPPAPFPGYPQDPDPEPDPNPHEDFCPDPDPQKKNADPKPCISILETQRRMIQLKLQNTWMTAFHN